MGKAKLIRHRVIRAKFWLFENQWWIAAVLLAAIAVILLLFSIPLAKSIPVLGVMMSAVYFFQKQKLEELKLFREIFRECNARYEDLRPFLAKLDSRADGALSSEERYQIVKYLNLCGEEYLYFRRGFIDPAVWEAWSAAMKSYLENPLIAAVWDQEKGVGSYYDMPI